MSDRPVAIITGASRGIGRGIAEHLAATHSVIGTYRGRRDAAEDLRAKTGCEILQCDVSSREDRVALLQFAREKFGRLDLLVNNAGMAPRRAPRYARSHEESFDELIATNLKGPHFLTQGAARWMVEQGRGPHRVHHVDFVLHGKRESRRLLHLEGRPEHDPSHSTRSGWRRTGCWCSRSGLGSSART